MSNPVFPRRANLHLWLLTGRSGDFFNPVLNTGVSYSVSDTPAEVRHMRQLLRLHDTFTDFYVLAVLGATRMVTALHRDLPEETDGVFAPGFLQLPPVSTSHPMLPPTGHTWPRIDGQRAGQEGFSRVSAAYVSAQRARIETNGGLTEEVTCSAVSDGAGGFRLAIDRLAAYGVHAVFLVPSWSPGVEVVVRLSPTRYPFAAVSHRLGQDSATRHLMTAEGVMPAFAESFNPALKVGLAGVAVMRRMQKLLNPNQIGFETERVSAGAEAEPLLTTDSVEPSFDASLTPDKVTADNPGGFHVV